MLKYELIKCMELHKKLAEKVTGTIFVSVTDNKFMVHIHGLRRNKVYGNGRVC